MELPPPRTQISRMVCDGEAIWIWNSISVLPIQTKTSGEFAWGFAW